MEHRTLPFSQRNLDWIFVGFFLLNIFFITYIVDIEQLNLPDPVREPVHQTSMVRMNNV